MLSSSKVTAVLVCVCVLVVQRWHWENGNIHRNRYDPQRDQKPRFVTAAPVLLIYHVKNILCLVYFAKDVKDRFGYGKLNK